MEKKNLGQLYDMVVAAMACARAHNRSMNNWLALLASSSKRFWRSPIPIALVNVGPQLLGGNFFSEGL